MMRFTPTVLVVALAACAPRSVPAPAAAPSAQRLPPASLDTLAPRWLAERGVPSIAIAYIADGAVQWTRVYGEQAPGVPATAATLYNVASLAKPVFAETVLRLASAGRLSLDEPMNAHWVDPDVAADPRHERLTLRVALSHRTGFANWRRQTGGRLAFSADPGTALGYSGEGYEYARRYVERKLGAPLAALAREQLFAPLGMTSTAHTEHDWFAGRVALPFGPEGAYGRPAFAAAPSAADDLYTTAADYAAFVASVMRRDRLTPAIAAQRDSVHVVNAQQTASCDPARVTHCPRRIGMALGWEVIELPGETVRLHTGGDWGESAMALYIPERGEGAVVLTNGAAGMRVVHEAIDLLFHDTAFGALARSMR